MAEIEQYFFRDDHIYPNSPLPVLLYKNALTIPRLLPATRVKRIFKEHGWSNNWNAGIFEYHHYHSVTHEVLGVYKGHTTLQLGGPFGQKVFIEKGDVLLIPAGVAHKNLGRENAVGVIGAYPGGHEYDMNYAKSGERPATDENIKKVPFPATDPIGSPEGMYRLWKIKRPQ